VAGYLKYSPVGSGLGIESFGNREIAVGFSWTRKLKTGHPLSASLDFANLSFTVDDSQISSTSFSLSAGYGW
jgi:hypothetical protein